MATATAKTKPVVKAKAESKPKKMAAATLIIMVPRQLIIETEDNPRIFIGPDNKNPSVLSLVQLIKASGEILEPLLGRPHPTKKGMYELRAGARRFRAAGVLGLNKVPMIVREMSDLKAAMVTATENDGQEPLTPLERARSIAMLKSKGWSNGAIANELGLAERVVARRLGVASLDETWLMLLARDSQPVHEWSLSHLELIARFPKDVQAEIAKEFKISEGQKWRYDEIARISLAKLDHQLSNFIHSLSGAPWKLDDSQLVPAAGSCADCMKRSDKQPELFDECETGDETKRRAPKNVVGRCLDCDCFQKKVDAAIRAKETALIAEHGKVIHAAERPYKVEEKYPGAKNIQNITTCKKGDKGAVPVLIVEGPRAGQTSWAKQEKATPGSGEGGRTKSAEQKKCVHDKKRAKHIIKALIEKLEGIIAGREIMACTGEWTLALVSVFGTWASRKTHGEYFSEPILDTPEPMDETVDECMIDPFKEVVSRAEMPMTEHIKYLGASAMGTLRSRLYYFESAIRTETNEIDFRECQNICSLMKWDYAELEEAAAAAHPYPKQWARLEKNTPSPLTSAEEYALEVQAEAAISEAEQPAIEQEKGQHSYTDEKGRILSVSSGISQGNTFITVRRVPGKTGSHRVVSSKLPARKKRELAQKDLDAYAVAKSYKIYELSVPQ